MKQTFRRAQRQTIGSASPLIVDRPPARTVATWGITGPEIERLSGALGFMDLHCRRSRCGLWLVTTNRGACRSVISDVWKRISRLQGTYRLHRYSVTTFESRGGLHAHITFIGTCDIANRLKASKQFGDLIDVRPVTDNNGLRISTSQRSGHPRRVTNALTCLADAFPDHTLFRAVVIACASPAN